MSDEAEGPITGDEDVVVGEKVLPVEPDPTPAPAPTPAGSTGSMAPPPPGQPHPYMMAIHITWCDGNGNVWERMLDPTKFGGLIWTAGVNKVPGNQGNAPPPGGPKHKMYAASCPPSPPAGNGCCYWNGNDWICPPSFG